MYLHIGKDIVIKTENIVGIFNIASFEKKYSLENICKNLKISDKILDISDNNQKSLIIVKNHNETKGYITNISSTTLGKRSLKYERTNQ